MTTPGIARVKALTRHTISKRSLVDQLGERTLTWKGYYESIPTPGSKAIFFPDVQSHC